MTVSVAHGCWFSGILCAESMTSGDSSSVVSRPGQLAHAGTQIVSEIQTHLLISINPLILWGILNPYVSDLFAS